MSAPALSAAARRHVPGWFGKLPGLGDFASRRLPEPFVRRWDGWLQAGLAHAQAADPQWLARYLVAPIRRFWLAPGLLDAAGWGGVLMPSVDRVGRHFPLTLAQPVDTLGAALASRDWYAALDRAARRVLDMDYTVDDFEQALAALACTPNDAADGASRRLAAQVSGRSVWWCEDAGMPAGVRGHADLPPPEALSAMLRGAS